MEGRTPVTSGDTLPGKTDMQPNKSHNLHPVPALIIICLAVFAVYSGTLHAPFMIDDAMYIVDNVKLRDLSNLWPPYGTRYFGYLSFALNYRLGGLEVFGYHLTNVLIHIGSAFLVYEIVAHTFRTEWMKGTGLSGDRTAASAVAITTALLFAVHPLQTQAVTYITQRFASLAAFFYLLSLLFFIRWRNGEGKGAGRGALYAFSVASAVFAQMSKEISFTLPAVIVIYDLVFYRAKGGRLKYLSPFLLTLAVIPLTMLAPKLGIRIAGPGIDEKIMAAQVHELLTFSRYDYLLTQFRVIVTYLRLLVLPVNQNWAYDYPVSHSLLELRVVSSLIFLLSVFAAAVWAFVRARSSGNGYLLLAACGVFWFFITLSIESSVIPIKDVIFEHRLYLPSVGAALTFSSLSFLLFERLRRLPLRVPAAAFAAFLMLVTAVPLALATYSRNLIWSDMLTFYEDVVAKSPNLPTPHYDLGVVYKKLGRIDDAIEQYRIAISLKPDYYEAHNNLGNAYLEKGMVQEAADEYKEAVGINPGDAEAHYNLGNLYYGQSMFREAAASLHEAITLDPAHSQAHNSLGNTYLRMGLLDRAAEEYKKTLELDPGSVYALSNMGNIHLMRNRLDEAVNAYTRALELDPKYAGARYNLGVAYYKQGRIDSAIEAYKKAIELTPGNGDAHFSLAVAYYSKKDLVGAVREFKAALRIDPEDFQARLRLADTLREKGETAEALEHYRYFVDYAPQSYSLKVGAVKALIKELSSGAR